MENEDFLSRFLSPEARERYNAEPKAKRDHNGKMRGQSELGRMGYSTQQPRHHRRGILPKAVAELGLKKVVDTIVMNLKRSKTWQNPPVNAISIWERDLEWIKKEFWREEFPWPDYSRLGA